MIAVPKKATTIILLREKEPKGFEVFLLKRHEKSSFMGGNFVYPGGRVDREDGLPETYSCCSGLTGEKARRILGEAISPDESLAYWIAGIRELFEEAGVLFACDRAGNPLVLQNQIGREKFAQYRMRLEEGTLSLLQLAQEENLVYALDPLHYYARWVTPEARPERFDTCFFLACHPAGQEASHDQRETTEEVWLTPRRALEENLTGGVALSPPTLKTLEDLCRFESTADVIGSLQEKVIKPVLPVLTKIAGEPSILFPWDPEYELFQRGESLLAVDHGRASRPDDNSTRLIFREGRWHPHCRSETAQYPLST
jgi:8-oxo-dGTP pyrophosphatase MutT (NUDIX family)